MLGTFERWFVQSTVEDAREKARMQRAIPEECHDAIAVALLVNAAWVAAQARDDRAGALLMQAAQEIANGLFCNPKQN